MSKKSCFRGRFGKQHSKRAEALLESSSQHIYPIIWSLPSQLSSKPSLWLTWQMLGLFLNTLAGNEKYPFLKRDNLTVPIQMQLSQKRKTFSEFFAECLKSAINSKSLEKKKDDPHRFCNSEITDSEKVVR